MDNAALLVIGAGPMAWRRPLEQFERGIETIVVGAALAFWREHMSQGMFLRSGPDWHQGRNWSGGS